MPVDPEAIRATRTSEFPEAFHEGVPNRDIPEGLWQTFDKDVRNVLRKSPLFNVKKNSEMQGNDGQPDDTPDEPAPAPEPEQPPAA